ncbi:hypothetical protein OOZ19_00085 [Saccharopolyspora sp. NFXS83]|uniref:hypothetical protein n=1 Tax=Saccharopolyspora sp. NFXS83 TaxID=2993560 RepID=UPI00224B775E|nr:hypothetical protein [Saccharopolyspora sp. NFXS83]MCX2728627.1 hypothetical protein [Saccharopolyspora sp. NFXS83]
MNVELFADREERPRGTREVVRLAEIDPGTDEPDPEQIRPWGVRLPAGSAVVYWRGGGKNRFATFGSASRAVQRFGTLYDLVLVYL